MAKPKRLSISELTDWRFGFFLFLAACARLAFARDTLATSPSQPFQSYRIARNLVLNGYFGEGAAPDAYMAPLYPTILALVYSLGVELDSKAHFLLNTFFDLVALAILLLIGRRSQGALAGFGLLFMALSPLWVSFSVFPNALGLSLALFSGYLYFWTHPKRSSRHEALAGALLGLLSLSQGLFYFLPLVVAAIAMRFRRKRSLLLHFLMPALAIPLPWLIRNVMVLGKPLLATDTFVLLPAITRPLSVWFANWSYPYATLWLPKQIGELFLWIFLAFVPLLGMIGWIREWDPRSALHQATLGLAAYLMAVTLLFPIDFPTVWIPYCVVSLWSGSALLRLSGVKVPT